MKAQWPLRARASEVESVIEAVSHEPGAAVLVGPAGVGKTRIARGVADQLAAEGYPVEWVAATRASAAVPFGAFARFLDHKTTETADRFWLLHEIRGRLLAAADDRPVVLAVDDAHWLDDGSAALVNQLAAVPTARLLLTIRSGEQVSDAVERLWRDGHAVRTDVGSFSLAAVSEVVGAALDGPVDLMTAGRLRKLTGGNALFLRELVGAALDDGGIRRIDGVWRWDGAPPLTTRLQDLLQERFAACAAEDLEALRLVALGEPLEVEALAGVVGLPRIEALCERVLLKTDDAGTMVQLGHPLYGESLLATTPPLTARRLRRVLADALAGLPDDPDLLLRRVTFLLDAGERPTEAELLAAAERAVNLYDAQASERLTRALDPAQPAHAMLLARALGQQERPAEAEEVLAGVDTDQLDPQTLVQYITVRGQNFAYGLFRTDLAMEFFDQLLPRVPAGVAPALQCLRANVLMFAGRYREAVEVSEANPWLKELDVDSPFILLVPGLALALAQMGRGATAIAWFEARDYSSLHPEHRKEFAAVETYTLFSLGRLEAADALAARMSSWGVELMWPWAASMGACFLGMVEFARGRMHGAAKAFRESVSLSRDYNVYGIHRWVLAWLAASEAACGRHQAAEEALAEWAQLSRRWETHRYFREQDEVLEAFTLARMGRVSEVRAKLPEMARRYAEASVHMRAVEALHLLARLGAAGEAARRLGRLAEECETPVPLVHAAHIRALADRSPEALLAVAAEYEALGMCHLAAEAADAAASLYAEHSEVRRAAAARNRRDGLLASCDIGPLPWWPSSRPEHLTARENEIARLAVSGMTSTEIAAHLVISARTVENHLQRVYTKLGLSGRSELATLFSDSQPGGAD